MSAPEGPTQPGAGYAELVSRIKGGDCAAEEALVHEFQRRVLSMMTVRVRNRETARDLCQHVMIAAIVALREGRLREPDRLPGFLHGIARHMINHHFEASSKSREEYLAEGMDVAQATPDTGREEKLECVRRALTKLSLEDQQIVMMVLLDGLNAGEIAARLSLNPDAVRQRKSRAIKRLTDEVQRMSQKPGRKPLELIKR